MNFLTPGGDVTSLASYCQLRTPTNAQKDDLAEDAEAAAGAVEGRCGPVLSRPVSYRILTATRAVATPSRVAEVLSFVGDDGSTLTAADFLADGQTVRRPPPYLGLWIPAGVLTYRSGWAQPEIPAPLITAGRMIARQLWRARLGNQRVEGEPGVGVLIPRQAELLMEPYQLAPMGFA